MWLAPVQMHEADRKLAEVQTALRATERSLEQTTKRAEGLSSQNSELRVTLALDSHSANAEIARLASALASRVRAIDSPSAPPSAAVLNTMLCTASIARRMNSMVCPRRPQWFLSGFTLRQDRDCASAAAMLDSRGAQVLKQGLEIRELRHELGQLRDADAMRKQRMEEKLRAKAQHDYLCHQVRLLEVVVNLEPPLRATWLQQQWFGAGACPDATPLPLYLVLCGLVVCCVLRCVLNPAGRGEGQSGTPPRERGHPGCGPRRDDAEASTAKEHGSLFDSWLLAS